MDFSPAAFQNLKNPRESLATGGNVGDQWADLSKALVGEGEPPHAYLLLLRFGVANMIAVSLLAAAYIHGWIDLVRAADPTQQCTLIFIVFLGGWGLCTQRIWRVSWELNQVRCSRPLPRSRTAKYLAAVSGRGADARAIAVGSLRTNLMARLGVVRQMASTLVLLGLIGTVIGFIMSLGGIKPEVASDPSAVAEMISTLIQGMSVALYTTLVGAVLNIWLTVNFSILHTGTQRLLSRIVDRGEAEVGC